MFERKFRILFFILYSLLELKALSIGDELLAVMAGYSLLFLLFTIFLTSTNESVIAFGLGVLGAMWLSMLDEEYLVAILFGVFFAFIQFRLFYFDLKGYGSIGWVDVFLPEPVSDRIYISCQMEE